VFNEIRKVFKDAEIEILKGYKGQFDVIYEDDLLYSNKTNRRLPKDGDIIYYLNRKVKS